MRKNKEEIIIELLGGAQLSSCSMLSGGSINEVYKVTKLDGNTNVIKFNSEKNFPLLLSEFEAVKLIRSKSDIIKTPEILKKGVVYNQSFLIMNYIEPGVKTNNFWSSFGFKLSEMHKNTSEFFGLDKNNFIGSLEQKNTLKKSFIDFFICDRLEEMLKSTANYFSKNEIKQFDNLFTELHNIIPEEGPALIHGDLWSGNFLCDKNEEVVLIDPCTHYSHREMEISFTYLFGGFDTQFYSSYTENTPIEPGFSQRIQIYNLYPLLVHLNLFGKTYLAPIQQTLKNFN